METPQRRKRDVMRGADDAKEPERRLAWRDNVGQREFARALSLAPAGGDKIGSAQQLCRHIFGGINADHRRLRRETALVTPDPIQGRRRKRRTRAPRNGHAPRRCPLTLRRRRAASRPRHQHGNDAPDTRPRRAIMRYARRLARSCVRDARASG